MIISLLNICHHTYIHYFSCDEDFKIYFLGNFHICNKVLLTGVSWPFVILLSRQKSLEKKTTKINKK